MSQATILIAEDDVNLSEILKTNLVSLGYSVLSAHDGEEAEKLIFANSPDLSLLDIMMPKKSGIEVLEAMKNNPATKDLAAMMLSNLGQKADLDKCKALGAKDYLIKANVSLSEIVKKIDEYLKANPPKEKPATAEAVKATGTTIPTAATPEVAVAKPTEAAPQKEEKIQPAISTKSSEQQIQPVPAITNGNGNSHPQIQTQFIPQPPLQMQQMPMAGAPVPTLVQMPPMYTAQYPGPQYYMLVPVQFVPQFPQIPQDNGNQKNNNHNAN